MIKGYQSEILKIYEKIRFENEHEHKRRREEIEKKLPSVMNLEREINRLCIKLALNNLKTEKEKDTSLELIKEKITDLKMRKFELLVSNNYDSDYLKPIFTCEKCKDTGFIGPTKCSCYNQKLVYVYYKNSELEKILTKENFDNFKFSYFSNLTNEKFRISPQKNIQEISKKAMYYVQSFNSSNENLLFYGTPGTGKTFLSHCIARELLNQGHFVLYKTAQNLFEDLKEIRLSNNRKLEDLLINCDLLIIDDLGTEHINNFTRTDLFNLINKKLLLKKKMLISTNYSLNDLSSYYSDRIISRLLGNFTIFRFYGDDLRIKLNMEKQKK